MNADAVAFFHQRGAVYDWEYEFLQDTQRKRDLSDRQMATRIAINQKVLAAVQRRGFRGPDA